MSKEKNAQKNPNGNMQGCQRRGHLGGFPRRKRRGEGKSGKGLRKGAWKLKSSRWEGSSRSGHADEHCDDHARARSGAGRSSWSWPRSRGWGMRQWPALAGPGGRIRQGLAMEGEREAQGKPSGLRFERKVCETKQAGEVPECGVQRLGMGRIERSCLGPLGQSPRPSSFSPSLFLSPSHICRAMRNAGRRLMGSRFPLMITISRRWV